MKKYLLATGLSALAVCAFGAAPAMADFEDASGNPVSSFDATTIAGGGGLDLYTDQAATMPANNCDPVTLSVTNAGANYLADVSGSSFSNCAPLNAVGDHTPPWEIVVDSSGGLGAWQFDVLNVQATLGGQPITGNLVDIEWDNPGTGAACGSSAATITLDRTGTLAAPTLGITDGNLSGVFCTSTEVYIR